MIVVGLAVACCCYCSCACACGSSFRLFGLGFVRCFSYCAVAITQPLSPCSSLSSCCSILFCCLKCASCRVGSRWRGRRWGRLPLPLLPSPPPPSRRSCFALLYFYFTLPHTPPTFSPTVCGTVGIGGSVCIRFIGFFPTQSDATHLPTHAPLCCLLVPRSSVCLCLSSSRRQNQLLVPSLFLWLIQNKLLLLRLPLPLPLPVPFVRYAGRSAHHLSATPSPPRSARFLPVPPTPSLPTPHHNPSPFIVLRFRFRVTVPFAEDGGGGGGGHHHSTYL